MNAHTVILLAWAALWGTWGVLALGNKRVESTAGKRFMSLHVLLMGSAFVLALSGPFLLPWRVLPALELVDWIGAGVTWLGVAFALWARFYLGTNWSGTPTIKVGHELVRSGPYALARHPIYTGIWVGLLGSSIAAGTVQGVLAVVLMTVAYARKIPVEEKQLRDHFGEAYATYAREVKALLPFVI
jgi:protein-S-isoprenylcysteine O-methyltransferase Ste14